MQGSERQRGSDQRDPTWSGTATSVVRAPSGVEILQPWIDAGALGPAEVHTAAVIAELVAVEPAANDVVLAIALAVWAPQHGHACIDLDTIAADVDAELAVAAADGDIGATGRPQLPWPEPDRWHAAVSTSAAIRVVRSVDIEPVLDDRPAVLFGRRLYTQRQWADECVVAVEVGRRSTRECASTIRLSVLERRLPPLVDGQENPQHTAAAVAASAALTVIAGGPGTGKTHTVAGLLAAEVAGGTPVRIGLAAPTGKAASRLSEAIAATAELASANGDLDAAAAARLSELRAVTVHRLLGPRPDHRTRFRHHADDPLALDLLVVDETSMLALPLTARLLEAVPDECRLVLVGDPDQLTSIEVGAVLGDIVRAAEPGSPLSSRVVRLTVQHRTGADSPIGPLAEAIRQGDADATVDLLRGGSGRQLQFVEVADGDVPHTAVEAVLSAVGPSYTAARDAALSGDRDAALELVATARILCGHRRGPFGVAAWNESVEELLGGARVGRSPPPGRALLATRNDPRTGLVNGDHGVLVRSGTGVRAAFRRRGELVTFDLAELDAVDTAYALTVHKSQGSEYDIVAVVHPPADSPLVSRELLYTAVTRTAGDLVVVASVESIRRAVMTPTRRVTGLADAVGLAARR